MAPDEETKALDRHALAFTIWLTAGIVVATSYHFGIGAGGSPFIAAAFVAVGIAFAGHVVINFTLGADFNPRELALGLVIYAAALAAFGVATLLSPAFARQALLPTSLGFIALLAEFAFYMVAKSGLRSAFEAFDVIRSFRARATLDEGSAHE